MKRYYIRDAMNDIAEPPRKTWFWELEAAVINAERCVQCGVCVAVCPSNSIGVHPDTGMPELVKMCTGCSLCWDFCPRGGLRYEATWPPATPAVDAVATVTMPDPADPYFSLEGAEPDADLGRVLAAYSARASQQIVDAQDGGVVTALLCSLLASGAIDGALVTRESSDPDEPRRGVATVATTPAEIRAAAGSYYNQPMALAALDLSRYALPSKPTIAVVATGCSLEGLRAMQMRKWPTGNHQVSAVTLTIGLMCSKSFHYDGLVTDDLADHRAVDLERVGKIDVTRGRLATTYRDGAVAVDEPVRAFHRSALAGCAECADFLARGADLAVGSVGSDDGWTTILVRTARGATAIDRGRGALDLRSLDDAAALLKLDRSNRTVADDQSARTLDSHGDLFIEYEDHAKAYAGTTRAPVEIRR